MNAKATTAKSGDKLQPVFQLVQVVLLPSFSVSLECCWSSMSLLAYQESDPA